MSAIVDLSPEATVRRLFDALNERDFTRAAGAVSERCVWESVAAETVHHGSAPIVDGLRGFAEAFPDGVVEIRNLVASGRFVVVEWTTRGTHSGWFRGRAPTGRTLVRRGCSVAEVEGGKIVAYRDYYDRATLDEQLAG